MLVMFLHKNILLGDIVQNHIHNYDNEYSLLTNPKVNFKIRLNVSKFTGIFPSYVPFNCCSIFSSYPSVKSITSIQFISLKLFTVYLLNFILSSFVITINISLSVNSSSSVALQYIFSSVIFSALVILLFPSLCLNPV